MILAGECNCTTNAEGCLGADSVHTREVEQCFERCCRSSAADDIDTSCCIDRISFSCCAAAYDIDRISFSCFASAYDIDGIVFKCASGYDIDGIRFKCASAYDIDGIAFNSAASLA